MPMPTTKLKNLCYIVNKNNFIFIILKAKNYFLKTN